MEELILAILIVLVGSGICSMVEAALFATSSGKANILLKQKRIGATSLVKIKENLHRSIIVIVIFNNIFNIVGSMVVGFIAMETLGNAWMGVVSGVFTFLVIIFSEIVPKTLGTSYSEPIALYTAKPLLLITRLFLPVVWFIDLFIKSFSTKEKIVSEEEIRILSHLGHIEGSIETDEEEMIQKIFTLNDLTAKDIMTPRTVVRALRANEMLSNLKDEIYSLPHSRLPVYKDNLDNIIGVCHQRDLLIALGRGYKEKKIKEFIKKDYLLIVNENIKLDELIPLFQKQKIHLAIVTDEFGGTSGIVTLEDALEQVVGEIVDETDESVDLRIKAKKISKKI